MAETLEGSGPHSEKPKRRRVALTEDAATAGPSCPAARPHRLEGAGILAALQRRAVFGTSGRGRRSGLEPWCCPRLRVEQTLAAHHGCVNSVAWRRDGAFLASGSDDTDICLWSYAAGLELAARLRTGHWANIFCAAFLAPELLASCSLDGTVRLLDAATGVVGPVWDTHSGAVQKLITDPQNEFVVLSGGEDGAIQQHDRRDRSTSTLLDWRERFSGASCLSYPAVVSGGGAVHSMASCTMKPHLLAIGGEDPFVWLYDLRMLEPRSASGGGGPAMAEPLALFRPSQTPCAGSSVTGVAMSSDGGRLLASWSGHHVFEFEVASGLSWPSVKGVLSAEFAVPPSCPAACEFGGHSNRRTIKEVAYAGGSGRLVASGSDDGRLFLWHSRSGELAALGENADGYVVNTIAPHPSDLCLATGGIDHTVKFWAPTATQPRSLSGEEVDEVFKRNETDRCCLGPSMFDLLDLDEDYYHDDDY